MRQRRLLAGDWDAMICIIGDGTGDVLERVTIPTTRIAFEAYFARQQALCVALETGTHSPFTVDEPRGGRAGAGDVIVTNTLQLPMVGDAAQESEALDCERLALLARLDVRLRSSIEHRGGNMQRGLVSVRSRVRLVGSRTQLINATCGIAESSGARLPKCSVDAFHKAAWPHVPSGLGLALEPILTTTGTLSEQIKDLESEIELLAVEVHPHAQLLTPVRDVGTGTAVDFMLTIGDPRRFTSGGMVGPLPGLAPGRWQSGGKDGQRHVTTAGDNHVRWFQVQAAKHLMRRDTPGIDLKGPGAKITMGGTNISTARMVGVLLHALWVSCEEYRALRNTAAHSKRLPIEPTPTSPRINRYATTTHACSTGTPYSITRVAQQDVIVPTNRAECLQENLRPTRSRARWQHPPHANPIKQRSIPHEQNHPEWVGKRWKRAPARKQRHQQTASRR